MSLLTSLLKVLAHITLPPQSRTMATPERIDRANDLALQRVKSVQRPPMCIAMLLLP